MLKMVDHLEQERLQATERFNYLVKYLDKDPLEFNVSTRLLKDQLIENKAQIERTLAL